MFSLLTFTNKTAVSNNAKLVSINLAKATIERVKVDPESYFPLDIVKEEIQTVNAEKCSTLGVDCSLYTVTVNNFNYDVSLDISQSDKEKTLKLINVVVTVRMDERNIKSQVEGYVNYATYE